MDNVNKLMSTGSRTGFEDANQSGSCPTRSPGDVVEVSVVIPCLNEAQSIGFCVDKARNAFRDHGISGEVVVSDNGSTDGSIDIAQQYGARVVHARLKGYGSALRQGIEQ